MNAPFIPRTEQRRNVTSAIADGFDGVMAVGVTGHRHEHFNAAELAAITTAVRSALQAVAQTFPKAELRLVTSLASGADSIAADAAVGLGWAIQAVLPAAAAQYGEDFEDVSRSDFIARLRQASAILELPAGPGPLTGSDYERAGRIILEQSDLLIAVWDGQPARGRGGTAQIVAEAVARHIPVLHLRTGQASTACILWSGFDPHGLARTGLEVVARAPLTRLEEIGIDRGQDAGQTIKPKISPLTLVYPLFLAVLGIRRLCWSDFRSTSVHVVHPDATEEICKRTGRFGEALRTTALARYTADAQASHMALLYRGSFVANFSLSAVAVLLALAGLMTSSKYKWLLTASEVSIVITIVWLTHTGCKSGWHQQWIRQRHLAERLRCLILSAQLGAFRLGSSCAGELSSGAELRRTARKLGLPSVRIDAVYLGLVRDELATMLDDQIGYNQSAARRMHRLDHRLHRLGMSLFVLGATICATLLLIEIALHAGWLGWLDAYMPRLSIVTTMLSAELPAIGAAIYGIRMQGDFTSVAARAQALAESLSAIRQALEVRPHLAEHEMFDELQSCMRMTTQRMSAELADWRSAHSARPLILPG